MAGLARAEARRARWALPLGRRGLGDALGEDPHLTLRVGGREATISSGRHLEVGDLGAGGFGLSVERVDVADVDVNHGRRVRPEGSGTFESVPRLANHHEAVITQEQLGVGATPASRLPQPLLKAECRFQVLDEARRVLVQQVR